MIVCNFRTLSTGTAVQIAQARAAAASRRQAAAQTRVCESVARISAELPPDLAETVRDFVNEGTEKSAPARLAALQHVLAITPRPTTLQVQTLRRAFEDASSNADPVMVQARVMELQARALQPAAVAAAPVPGPLSLAVVERAAADPVVRFAEAACNTAHTEVERLSRALSGGDQLRATEPALCSRLAASREGSRAPWVILIAGTTLTASVGLTLAMHLSPPIATGLLGLGVAFAATLGTATHRFLNRNLGAEVERGAHAVLAPRLEAWEARQKDLDAFTRDVKADAIARAARAEGLAAARPAGAIAVETEGVNIGGIRVERRSS